MVEIALGLGIFFGLIFYEIIGFSAGGIVVPGYLALFLNQPLRVAGTFLASLATHFLVGLVSNYLILFGRRRFAFVMLLSFIMRWLWDVVLIRAPMVSPELRVIGYIIPGLIANDMERQGVISTICASLIVATFVRLVILTLQGWGLLL